jgi:serine-type D-Ala-D-Ala carboxypeptidase/endopeptidase (penicillin-binding protein 4)
VIPPRDRTLALCAILVCLAASWGAVLAASATGRGTASGQTVTTTTPSALSALQRTLSVDMRRAHGVGGAFVVDMDTGRTLFAASPTVARLPASVQKLYTTTAALIELGPDATFSTAVLGVGSLDPGGVWHGTLYLRGGGDPTFGSAQFDTLNYGAGIGATVQRLATRLHNAGIRAVRGAIVGDESFLDSARGTPATGMTANVQLEGELSALAFNEGFTSPAQDALQRRPALFATRQFAAAMQAAGVRVPRSTKIFTATAPGGARTLASISSPPLSTLLRLTNAPSDNFFAETLLKDLGARSGAGGTTAAGASIVTSVISQQFGLDPRFDDGSGLSSYDRTTPAQVVSLLEQMRTNHPFVESLAVAGVSGTMEREMLGTRAVGNCRGKTGTLSDVANLVGYCTDRNGDQLVFAFMLNSLASSDYGHLMEDRMGVALANFAGATGGSPTTTSGAASTRRRPRRRV